MRTEWGCAGAIVAGRRYPGPKRKVDVSNQIDVVGAIILQDALVLCAQRGPGTAHAGMWEFPGGKVEPGETPEEALVREIREELGCLISVGEFVNTTSYRYDFATVNLSTYYCKIIDGEPVPSEHSALEWREPSTLLELYWAPADVPAVERVIADLV